MEQQSIVSMLRKREQYGNDNIACGRVRSVKGCLESMMDIRLLNKCESHYQDLKPQPRSTIAADFDPQGRLLASTHGDHTIKIFEWGSLQPYRVLSGHRRTPWVIRWHPHNRNLLVTGSLDSDVRFWDTLTGQCVKQRTFDKPIASMAFHPNGDLLAVAAGHRIYFMRWKDDQHQPKSIYRAKKTVRAVAFHPHGHPLFITAEVNEKRGVDALRQQDVGAQSLSQRLLDELMAYSGVNVSNEQCGHNHQSRTEFEAFSAPSEADLRFIIPNYAIDAQQTSQSMPVYQRLQLSEQFYQQLLLSFQSQSQQAVLDPLNFAPFTLIPPPSVVPLLTNPGNSAQSQNDVSNWPLAAQQLLPSYGTIAFPDASLLSNNGMLISPSQFNTELVRHRQQMQGFPPLSVSNRQAESLGGARYAPPIHIPTQRVEVPVPLEELPITTIVKLWHLNDANLNCQKLSKPILTIPNAVLCSEMGLHISPCGRYLALCCVVGHPSHLPQQQSQGVVEGGTQRPPIRVAYELRVYSIENGKVLWSRAVRVGMCLTSVQWSPSSEYLLVAYGRRHIALLRETMDRSDGSVSTTHTIMEVYKVKGMSLVCVLPSSEDEVNVATWHPIPGEGIVYGTKEGRLRILKVRPPQPPSTPDIEQQDRDSVVTLENDTVASDDE